jgi:hypothetical protein
MLSKQILKVSGREKMNGQFKILLTSVCVILICCTQSLDAMRQDSKAEPTVGSVGSSKELPSKTEYDPSVVPAGEIKTLELTVRDSERDRAFGDVPLVVKTESRSHI